ncbi:MAG: patatin-like phospholipase family protein [Longimicrobiales bacterium]
MGTTLRLGFAMGGGVSLGTFNGSAMSQALKLLLLRGVDRDGIPYDRVELDIFSGASAGSMSLAIMLRGLACPDTRREAGARSRLAAEFGDEMEGLPVSTESALVAAQMVQDVHEEIWVREITLKKLLGREHEGAARRLRRTAGLVDRGALETLARKYTRFPSEPVDLSRRRILAHRVLFASSLANLSPILADAREEYPAHETALLGLSDGLTSSVHRELRVFDLHFTDLFHPRGMDPDGLLNSDVFPRRWCRYHAGEKIRDTRGSGRGIGSLLETRGWAKMTATSIASGAFPLAFEPVPLERRSYEFGETEREGPSLWPRRLRGKDRHVFTYMDGGTFNNEPIREAFRLASFLDAQAPGEDFERLIVFVDPHLVAPDPSLRLAHHGLWMLDEPNRLLGSLDGLDLEPKASLDRLIPVAASVGKAVMNESRVVEADKVFRTRKRFLLRNEIRQRLSQALSPQPERSVLQGLVRQLSDLLAEDRKNVMIPAGALSLEGELRRIMSEESGDAGLLKELEGRSPDEISALVSDPASAYSRDLGPWLRALTFAAVDRIMDLEGKMERARLVAISPATDPLDPGTLETLPGALAGGFGGFASELPGRHETAVARYCAQLFLQEARRIRKEPLPRRPVFFEADKAVYRKELKEGLGALEGRLADMMADSHVDLLGALPAGVLRLLIQGKLAGLAEETKKQWRCELRLEVPTRDFEFDGEGWADRDLGPVKIDGAYHLITFARYTVGEPRPWAGHHVIPERRALRVDRDRKGPRTDKKFCTVQLPTKPMLEEAEKLPYPVFVARLELTDEGKHVKSGRWKLVDPVRGLEEAILEEENMPDALAGTLRHS